MILTGSALVDFCLDVLGRDWKSALARALGVTRQTIHTRSKSKIGLSKAFKRQLLAAAEVELDRASDHLAIVSKRVNELREDVGP